MGKRKQPPTPTPTEDMADVDEHQKPAKQPKLSTETPGFKNKEKVLLLSSRGITHRYTSLRVVHLVKVWCQVADSKKVRVQIAAFDAGSWAVAAPLQAGFKAGHKNR